MALGPCVGRLAGQDVASLYAWLQCGLWLQALLADLAAEKEKESLTQKAKAKKAKAKGEVWHSTPMSTFAADLSCFSWYLH